MSTPCFAVDLVTFDVGGTLLTFRPDLAHAYAEVLAEAGCPTDGARLAAALDAERPAATARRGESVPPDHRVSVDEGARRRRTFVANVLRNAGVPPAALDGATGAVQRAYDSPRMYAVYDDALPTVRELWGRGLKLGVVANSWPSMPRILLDLGFGDYLGFWVISEFVGVEKPHPAIFARALEIGASEPARALHVGDDYARDVVGAREVGMQAVLLTRHDQVPTDLAHGIPMIRRLDELLTVIG
ncbi:MAG TPA: HAD-IA family hydrolase [Thermomicrobiaceae bacterium]|nr:HAD-IA family hydrolase [Thermomicrobiaceae bacterium]